MTLNEALDYYKGNKARLARAIGYTAPSVNMWIKRGGEIPILAQLRIQKATRGKLKADPLAARKGA